MAWIKRDRFPGGREYVDGDWVIRKQKQGVWLIYHNGRLVDSTATLGNAKFWVYMNRQRVVDVTAMMTKFEDWNAMSHSEKEQASEQNFPTIGLHRTA